MTVTPGVLNVLQTLKFIATQPDGALYGDISHALGNPASATLVRTLKQLRETAWLRKDADNRYRPGPVFVYSACCYVSETTGEDQIGPIVRKLAEETGHSAAFAKWHQGGIHFHAKWEMPESFHYIAVGKPNRHYFFHGFNIHCLAYADEDTARDMFNAPHPRGKVFASWEDFLSTRRAIREAGVYCMHDTVHRVTAPVFYRTDSVLAGVIGVSSPVAPDKNTLPPLRKTVREAAATATRIILKPTGDIL